jgi:tetratricopeptide (TPR) repeat protein
MIDEELAEPELMNFSNGNKRAIDLIKMCVSLINSKDWTTIITYLNNSIDVVIQENSDFEETCLFYVKNFYLGVANFKLSNYELALSSFFDAIKINNYFQLNYNIALCYIKLENYENAVFYLEKVTKANKSFFFAYYNLIKIYLKKNNVNDAYLIYRDFSDLIKKDKENQKSGTNQTQIRLSTATFNALKLFYKLGAECCFAKSLYQECVLTILEALRFNPEDPGNIFILNY